MFTLWMEWDYGQEDLVFTSRDDAVTWIERNVDLSDFDPPFASVDYIFEEGLAGIKPLRLWKP